jgi:hypothetical protein
MALVAVWVNQGQFALTKGGSADREPVQTGNSVDTG